MSVVSFDSQPRRAKPAPGVIPLELPANIEAEQAVLGSIMQNRESILMIKDWLAPSSFYLSKNRQIYEAALTLVEAGTPPDAITVYNELKIRGQAEGVGGILYLTELIQSAPTSYHIQHYAEAVDLAGWQRASIAELNAVIAMVYSDPQAAGIEAEPRLTKVLSSRHKHTTKVFHISELWAQQFPPLQVIIEGLLYEGLTLFSGKPKMGKSQATIDAAAAIASPDGLALGGAQCQHGPVLYLCLEDPTAALQERLESILHGRPNIPFYYQLKWPALDAGGLQAIEAWLDQYPDAKLVVVDTLASIAPAPDARKTSYQADYDGLKGLQRIAAARPGLAIVVNTHSRKAGADDVLDEISGTTGKSGAVDHVWVMRRTRGDDEAELHIQPRRAASAVRALTFDPQSVSWRIGGDAEASKAASMRADILATLADDDFWPNDLASYLDIDTDSGKAQVRKQLQALKKQGLVEKADKGKYSLTRLGRQSAEAQTEKDQGDQGIRDQRSKPGTFRPLEGFEPEVAELEPAQQALIPDPLIPSDILTEQARLEAKADKEKALEVLLKPIKPDRRWLIRLWVNSYKAVDRLKAQDECQANGVDYVALHTLIHGSAPQEVDD